MVFDEAGYRCQHVASMKAWGLTHYFLDKAPIAANITGDYEYDEILSEVGEATRSAKS